MLELFLINILHQTATSQSPTNLPKGLFLINILHQTATNADPNTEDKELFLINILHQTATEVNQRVVKLGCSLSIFYIKPQRCFHLLGIRSVVPYQYSTSNRNRSRRFADTSTGCSLSIFYIKPQLSRHRSSFYRSCSLSIFYIKPQRMRFI